MKKQNYAAMFTLRKDGLYMGHWRDSSGKRHAVYDRDPERLFYKLQEKEQKKSKPLTFCDIADSWERKHTDRIGIKTAETYIAPLRRIKDTFGDHKIEDVTAGKIQAFISDLGKQGFARRTVQMHRDILNMIFNNAVLEHGLKFNPCSAVTIPRNLTKTRRKLPTDAEIEAVKRSGNCTFGLFALICLYAGLRRGEALALTFADIDRKAGLIHVTKAVEFIGNNPHIKPPKTDAGNRTVPLLQPLADVLPVNGSGALFCSDGKLLTKTQFRKRWLKYCEEIGCSITAHQLRHGYATILYEAGIQDKDAQELLGHSSIAVTRDVYTHIRSARKLETAKKLNDFVSGVVNRE